MHLNTIPKRTAKTLKGDLHDITVSKAHAVSKTKAIRTEEVDVNVARVAMLLELEMMVLNIAKAVAHLGFTGTDFSRPDNLIMARNDNFA